MPEAPLVRLTGERVVLEPLAVEHAVEMVGVLSSPSLYVLIGGRPPSLSDLTTRYLRQTAEPESGHEAWLNWIVRYEGRAVGFVQATLREEGGVLNAAVAWLVRPEHQGHGLATEAAGVMVEHLRALGAAITAWISDANHASVAVATRLALCRTAHQEDGEQLWTDSRQWRVARPGMPAPRCYWEQWLPSRVWLFLLGRVARGSQRVPGTPREATGGWEH